MLWAAGDGTIPVGNIVNVTLRTTTDPTSPALGTYSVKVGTPPKAGLHSFVVSQDESDTVNLGTAVFFHFQVYFDQAGGREGLAPL